MTPRSPKRAAGIGGRALALVAAVLLMSASAASAAHARRSTSARSAPMVAAVNIPSIGAYASARSIDRTIAWAHALHVTAVRTNVSWSILEPTGAGAIEPRALASIDRLVADAAAAGIKVIMTVDYTPCWASSAPARLLRRCTSAFGGAASAWPPTNPADYAAFVAFLARRYGPHLAAIEIWNEPDQANQDYFAGPEKPRRYAAILRAAYPAIKQADPSLPVLAGSLTGSNGVFLRALYAAGIKGYYDGLAVHYYNLTIASLRSIREVQLANGDTTPLWLDEFGWSSCWPRHRIQQEQACVAPGIQATNIVDTFRALGQLPYLAAGAIYKLSDSPGEEFGLLSAGGARKPSFSALARVLAHPSASGNLVRLRLHAGRGDVVASGSAPVGDFMELEVFRAGIARYRAIFTLDRFNRYSIPLPAVLGTSGLTVRVFQYGAGPSQAAYAGI